MPANREAPPARARGPRLSLLRPDLPPPRGGRARPGPGQFVMIKAGLGRAAAAAAVLDPGRRPGGRDASPSSSRRSARARAPSARSSPGEPAQCLGPLGRPFTPPSADEEALLVAGGYGIAPFRLFGEELRRTAAAPASSTAAARVRDLQLRERFEPLGVPLVAATEDGSPGRAGTGDGAPRRTPRRLRRARFGSTPAAPTPCSTRWRAWPKSAALPAEVSLDPWMGCGIGTCLGCVVFTQARRTSRRRSIAAPAPRARSSTPRLWSGPATRSRASGGGPWCRHEPRGRALRPAPQEPLHRGLGHLRLRRRVRGPARPLACSAASSRRASTSSRATAAPPRASRRRPPAC